MVQKLLTLIVNKTYNNSFVALPQHLNIKQSKLSKVLMKKNTQEFIMLYQFTGTRIAEFKSQYHRLYSDGNGYIAYKMLF